MKILVADDDAVARLLVSKTLSRLGEVTSCEDGAEACREFSEALAANQAFDLVCLDIMMPNMTGLEALQHIRREEVESGQGPSQPTPVIMITALDANSEIDIAFRELCDAYLVKPIHPDRLINVATLLCPSS